MKSYKKDQRGITHNLMLAGIAVLVLGAIGFAGFRVYKSKNDISAKAYSWSRVPSSVSSVTVYACKTGSGSGRFYVRNDRSNNVKVDWFATNTSGWQSFTAFAGRSSSIRNFGNITVSGYLNGVYYGPGYISNLNYC